LVPAQSIRAYEPIFISLTTLRLRVRVDSPKMPATSEMKPPGVRTQPVGDIVKVDPTGPPSFVRIGAAADLCPVELPAFAGTPTGRYPLPLSRVGLLRSRTLDSGLFPLKPVLEPGGRIPSLWTVFLICSLLSGRLHTPCRPPPALAYRRFIMRNNSSPLRLFDRAP